MSFSDSVGLTFKINADNSGAKKAFADASQFVQGFVKNAEKSVNFSNFKNGFSSVSGFAQKTASEVTESFRKIDKEAESTAQKTKSHFNSAFSGGFLGSIGGSIVSSITSQLAQIPAKVSEVLNDAVKIAEEKTNALKGLESIATFKGVDPAAATATVQNLRLVKAGIIDLSDGATGLKNLLATGLSLDQSRVLLERFSDSAAFGKQAALSYGDAIRSATEGIKNQNSAQVDNVGVTKNVAAILEDAGFKMEDLGDKTKKAAAINALYKGLVTETAAQVGDADKLTQGYTGSVAGLDTAYKNLYGAVGKIITQSPEMIAANRILAAQVQGITGDLTKQGTETQKTADQWIKFYAEVKVASLGFAAFVKNLFGGVVTLVGGLAEGVISGFSLVIETAFKGIKFFIGSVWNFAVEVAAKIGSIIPKGISESTDYFVDNVNKMKEAFKVDTTFDLSFTKKLYEGANKLLNDSADYGQKMLKAVDETNAAWKQLKTDSDNIRKAREDEARHQTIKPKFFGKDGKSIESGDVSGGTSNTEGKAKKTKTELSPKAKAIIAEAGKLGISPLDYATIISFESAGTFSTSIQSTDKKSGKKYTGLIQFGEAEVKKYGVKRGEEFETQLAKASEFLRDRFEAAKKSISGASILDLYRTVLGGNPNASLTGEDSNGTSPLSGVRKMQREHRPNAEKLLGGKGSSREFDTFTEEEKLVKAREKTEDEAEKRRENARKQDLDSLIKSLDSEVELRDSTNKTILANEEKNLSEGLINEQGFARIRAELENDLFQKKIENKQKELDAVKAFNLAEESIFAAQAEKEIAGGKPEDRAALKAKYYDEIKTLRNKNFNDETVITNQLVILDDQAKAQISKNAKDIGDARKDSLKKYADALKDVDNVLKDFGFTVGEFGAKTGLQELNEQLAKPEVTEAIRQRAEAIGWTVEQLKELLRVQQEGADKGVTTGTRPRKVEEPEANGDKVSKGIDNIFGEDGDSKVNKAIQQGETLKGVFGSLSGVVQNAAKNMVDAFGSAIEGYILYGNSIGKALKQAAAAELAHIASVSAVKALYWTAQGIADLFFNPGRAANDFLAAAGFAALAVGTGVAARSLASSSGMLKGDRASETFKNQTSSGAISTTQGYGGSQNGGKAYSGSGADDKAKIIDEDRMGGGGTRRNQPQIFELHVKSNDSHITRVVENNVNDRGSLHKLIVKYADG